jgi:hypothetical protein
MSQASAHPARICAFCGRAMPTSGRHTKSREHCLAKWIVPYVKAPHTKVTHLITDARGDVLFGPWTAETFEIVTAKVCDDCNTGWMSGLEAAVKPHLIPLLEHHPLRVLDAPARRVLATWAAKTALALALANPGAVPIDPAIYRELERRRTLPPARTFVWLASYRGTHGAYTHQSDLTATDGSASAPGYAVTFSIAHVVFQVLGHAHPHRRHVAMPAGWEQAVQPIWPGAGLVEWPAPRYLDDPRLEAFASVWETEGPGARESDAARSNA